MVGTKRSYGWKPDIPDFRDFRYGAISKAVALPAKVDLRKTCSPVEDQGQLGSCVGNSVVGCLEFLQKKNTESVTDLSRLFAYYNARLLDNTTQLDCGAYIRSGIKGLAKYGVCTETQWPYIISKFAKKPTTKCYTAAKKKALISYHRIENLNDMLSCLADGYPFVFGFAVYDYFESATMARTGILKMPTANEQMLGGHAVMAVGYDQTKKRILVRNSWGVNWGLKGYFWMPYDYINSRDLADDMWTIRK